MNRRTFLSGLIALPVALKAAKNFVPVTGGKASFIKQSPGKGSTLTTATITALSPDDFVALGASEARLGEILRSGHMRINNGLYERYDGSAWREMQ